MLKDDINRYLKGSIELSGPLDGGVGRGMKGRNQRALMFQLE